MKLSRKPAASITIDGLVFALRWSRRRRTIGISVAQDGALRVLAPVGVSTRKLVAAVQPKLPWVRRKLVEFAAQAPPREPKQLVDGERLPYLGRTYRVVLVDDRPGGDRAVTPDEPCRLTSRGISNERVRTPATSHGARRSGPVALRHGRLELARGLDGTARAALVDWYTARARARVAARIAHFAPLVGASPATIVVRDLGVRRWGSCNGRTRTLSFHWELILQPPDLIDYVVVHELAHLRELNHQRGFWRIVEGVLPDCKERRKRLTASGLRSVV